MKNAIQLSRFGVTEVMLTNRSQIRPSDRKKITCSRNAYGSFKENWNDYTIEHLEEFKILLLNRSNVSLGLISVSKGGGGISGSVTDVGIILQTSLNRTRQGLFSDIITQVGTSALLKLIQVSLRK